MPLTQEEWQRLKRRFHQLLSVPLEYGTPDHLPIRNGQWVSRGQVAAHPEEVEAALERLEWRTLDSGKSRHGSS